MEKSPDLRELPVERTKASDPPGWQRSRQGRMHRCLGAANLSRLRVFRQMDRRSSDGVLRMAEASETCCLGFRLAQEHRTTERAIEWQRQMQARIASTGGIRGR